VTEKAKKIDSHQLLVVVVVDDGDDDDEINIKWAFNVVFRLLCLYLEFIIGLGDISHDIVMRV